MRKMISSGSWLMPAMMMVMMMMQWLVPIPLLASMEDDLDYLVMFYDSDQLVVTATRYPRPVSEVAENMEIITADEIEKMNAHTVAEVLARVPGVFVDFNGMDFGSTALIQIQGSNPRHARVMVDGITFNYITSFNAETNSIPVEIIERIEIIKGPASAVWGSALGGVINIITRAAGNTQIPEGSGYAAWGERHTQDYRARLSGKAGSTGYYLFAGRQESEGLKNSRWFDSTMLYSKFHFLLSDAVTAGLSIGFGNPSINSGEWASNDLKSRMDFQNLYAVATLDALLSRELKLTMSLYQFNQQLDKFDDQLSTGQVFLTDFMESRVTSASARLVWEHGRNSAVLGIDAEHGEMDEVFYFGPKLQEWGSPAEASFDPQVDTWAIYAGDSLGFGPLTLSLGIRFDNSSTSPSFISPSLGATYRAGEDTVFRTSVSRGYTTPPLQWTSAGGLFLDPNPELEEETVWSYQAGVETRALDRLYIKASAFYHELENQMFVDMFAGPPPAFNDIIINKGESRRQGVETQIKTAPFHHLSLQAAGAYTHIKSTTESRALDNYTFQAGVFYDDTKSVSAQLFGGLIYWDHSDSAYDMIWDATVIKKIQAVHAVKPELFFSAHNLFNGAQYKLNIYRNPRRWIEAGMRFSF